MEKEEERTRQLETSAKEQWMKLKPNNYDTHSKMNELNF